MKKNIFRRNPKYKSKNDRYWYCNNSKNDNLWKYRSISINTRNKYKRWSPSYRCNIYIKNINFIKENSIEFFTLVFLHEITHLLVFSKTLFPYFSNIPNIKEVEINGLKRKIYLEEIPNTKEKTIDTDIVIIPKMVTYENIEASASILGININDGHPVIGAIYISKI